MPLSLMVKTAMIPLQLGTIAKDLTVDAGAGDDIVVSDKRL